MPNETRASRRGSKRRKSKPKKRWLKITFAVLLVLFLSLVGYIFSIYQSAKNAVNDKMNIEVSSIDKAKTQEKVDNKEKLNILLLGVDKRAGDSGRSDALIFLTVDPKGKMQMISIPRDTRTEIVGKGKQDKINHAYAYGGVNMSVDTVEKLFDTDIDYYVEINMEGLSDLVDAIGGVTVENDLDWIDEGYYKAGYHYKKGQIYLDGPKTLGFVRMRHLDPKGDFGRTERQRKVINAIIDKGSSAATVTKVHSLIDVMGNNVQTNMTFDDMTNLLKNYRSAASNIDDYMLAGTGGNVNGVYYYNVSDEEIEKVKGMINE